MNNQVNTNNAQLECMNISCSLPLGDKTKLIWPEMTVALDSKTTVKWEEEKRGIGARQWEMKLPQREREKRSFQLSRICFCEFPMLSRKWMMQISSEPSIHVQFLDSRVTCA